MSLSDYVQARSAIEYKGKTLVEVRGLGTEDVMILIAGHLGELQGLYAMLEPGTRKLLPKAEDIERIIFDVITNAPGTAAKMIALASDEPNNDEAAKRLPMPLQMKILIEVVRLTFEDVGGPLAFAGMLDQALSTIPASPNPMIQ